MLDDRDVTILRVHCLPVFTSISDYLLLLSFSLGIKTREKTVAKRTPNDTGKITGIFCREYGVFDTAATGERIVRITVQEPVANPPLGRLSRRCTTLYW